MKSSHFTAAGLLVAIGVGCAAWLLFGGRPRPPSIGYAGQSRGSGHRGALVGQPPPVRGAPADLATARRPPLADALGAAGTPPEAEPGAVLAVLEAYRRINGGFPVGEDNRQTVRALLGANPSRTPFLPSDHPRLSPTGELLDSWGTPFFFHLLARDRIEVRSAGADREFYTEDDLLAPVRGQAEPKNM